jgi:hypothetical protein
MASFTEAGGLAFGMSGTIAASFPHDGEPFPFSITVDTLDPGAPALVLEHESRCAPFVAIRYTVGLETTPQPFGGVRWWFTCPHTGRRASRLFLPRGAAQFLSRHAYGLGYASQRLSKWALLDRRAQKIQEALRGDDAGALSTLPPKPKWMRWPTYDRQAGKLLALRQIQLEKLAASLGRLRA